MIRSESFRELCEDLAEAERALAATDQLPETLRFPRRVECQGWVESLTNEIEGMLREFKVVPLPTQTAVGACAEELRKLQEDIFPTDRAADVSPF